MSNEGELSEANFTALYTALQAGRKISISFSSFKLANTFRIRMSQYKKQQDEAMIALDMMKEEDKKVFSFRYKATEKVATAKFVDRPDSRQYQFLILDNLPDVEPNDEPDDRSTNS